MIYTNDQSFDTTKLIKLVLSFGFILLSMALIIIRNSPALGYESSIYNSTPILVWFFLFIAIVFGIVIIVYQTINYYSKYILVSGFLLILLGYIIVLSMHILRGYELWNGSGDTGTHFGYIKYIIYNGYTERQLFYPIIHIYLVEFSQLLGINPILLIRWIPVLFGVLYVFFIYTFAKLVFLNKGQIILTTLAAIAPIHGWYLMFAPNLLANLIFPMALFLIIKSIITKEVSWKILVLVIVILYPPFHPLPAFALIIIILTLWLPRRLVISLKNKISESRFYITVTSILIVWGITWISSFYVWTDTIRNFYTLFTEGGTTQINAFTKQAEYAGSYGYSVFEQFFKIYSGTVIYLLLAFIAFPILWKEWKKRNIRIKEIFFLYGPFMAFFFLITLLFVLNMSFGPTRFLIYPIIISTVFSGFVLYRIIEKVRFNKNVYIQNFIILLVILLIVGVYISGILSLYPSRYILLASYQTTKTEINGMDWFLHKKIPTLPISGLNIAPTRFADFLLTPKERIEHQYLSAYLKEKWIAPHHFGYTNNTSLGESYNISTYMVITEKDKRMYIDVYPEMAKYRFYSEDFEKLENDSSLYKLYSNSGLDIWYIHK